MSNDLAQQDKLAKLKTLRTKTDLSLRPTKHLKTTFTNFKGEEVPLVIRYYQVQGVLHLIVMKRFVLGDDTGLGKTLQVIAALCYIWEKDPQRKAIVLTTKSATRQWVDEFGKFTTGVSVFTCSGTPAQRKAIYKQFKASKGPTVMVMGYRTLVQDFTLLQKWEGFVLAADECVAFKNPKTQVHQVCRHMGGQADRVWGLTATLIKNHLMEGYGIYQVILPDLFAMSYNSFMMYYALTKQQSIGGNRHITVVTGYQPEKIREFRENIDPYFIGRPKHEVATELPSLTSKIVEVDLNQDQIDKYDNALEGLLEMGREDRLIEKEVTKLSAIAYCQEIVNHLELIDCEGGSSKLEAIVDLLTDAGEFDGEKVIIFSRFEKMISLVMSRLKAEKVKAVRVTGKENIDQRKASMDAFQDPLSDVRVICITTAGSEALNLQAAKAIICIDTPWSAGEFIQLVGRMIRIGSEHDKCYVVHLVARKGRGKNGETIDHRVMEVLGKKMVLVEAVLGKRIKGEGDEVQISVENDLSNLFAAMKQDAREAKLGAI